MKQNDGNQAKEQPTDPYTELYAAHQVHALAQLLIQRLQQAGVDPTAPRPEANEAEAETEPEADGQAQPLNYWYP